MRDWSTTLLPASYNGVPFYVESDRGEGGRRLVIHELAGSDIAEIEDFGASAGLFSITAYTVGDVADIASAALIAAAAAGGPGFLVLPADGGMMAYPRKWKRERSKDREGYFALEMDFVTKGSASGYALAIGMVASAFAAGISAAASALSSAF